MKKADTTYDLIPVVAERWSPRAFSDKELSEETLLELLEAARWAASSMNEQPWRFVYGAKGTEGFDNVLNALAPGNQEWAKNAAALVGVFGKPLFDYKDRANRTWQYDLGLAIGNLTAQATAKGVSMHQMGGVDLEKLRANTGAPEELEPYVAIALGYAGDPDQLSEGLKERELAKRSRKPLSEIAFSGQF